MATDLSASFDNVDHDILQDVLNNQFKILGSALEWFNSYFRLWSFCVNIGQSYSKKNPLDASVPQGSCTGPILYSNYRSTLRYVVPEGYTDDHAIKLLFSANDTSAETITLRVLENCAGYKIMDEL